MKRYDSRWSETKIRKFEINNSKIRKNHWQLFLLPLDGNETVYSYRTWIYIAQTEVKIFVTVIVSMVTI